MINLVPIETLINLDVAARFWPKDILLNDAFREQLEKREELMNNLNDIIVCLPRVDISVKEAIENGLISQEQAVRFYASLSDLLDNLEYKRLILYLPFEFLPEKSWQPHDDELKEILNRFRKTYMKAWENCLHLQDVRANFVDGDVIEIEQLVGDYPRVVKAAHLIPVLTEKGLVGISDVRALAIDDYVLKNSIADAFSVLDASPSIEHKEAVRSTTLSTIQKELSEEFSRIDQEHYNGITLRRKNWLVQTKKQKVINEFAEAVSLSIAEARTSLGLVIFFLKEEGDTACIQAVVEGVRKVIESAAKNDFRKALEMHAQWLDSLIWLYRQNNDYQVKEALLKSFHHFYILGMIKREQLTRLNIAIPELGGPFSANLNLLCKETTANIQEAVAKIESSQELSRLVYPIILMFGSRLKGYGSENSDVDLGIFVRPGVSFDARTRLHSLLKNILPEAGIIEFWLENSGDTIRVRDFPGNDPALGEKCWTHVLFGAAWIGSEDAIKQLFARVLVPYFYDDFEKIHGCNVRRLYLEEIERDSLQYRLMHKGYEKFFPSFNDIQYDDKIDSKSMFWDSGYRRIAVKLFIGRVFLPLIF